MALSKLLSTSAFRWLLGYVVAFLITAAAIIGYIFWQTNDLLTGQVIQTIAAEVNGLREQYQTGGVALLTHTLAERSLDPGNGLYLLVDEGARKLAGNLNRLPPELSADGNGSVFRYVRRTREGEEEREAVGVAIATPGGLTLVVGRDVEEQHAFAVTVRRIVIWGFGLLTVLGISGGVLASRMILRRIDEVTATSRRIMGGDLARRIPLTGNGDEIDRLSGSLNDMFERIEGLVAGLREVSDNIAHDLKTPLTRMRNRIDAALRDGPSGPESRAVLERTIEDADSLIRTFNALLSIARLEAGEASQSMQPTDLTEVARDAVELYEPLAEETGLRLELKPEGGGPFRAVVDRQLIGQALANLIDNAIKYAGPAGVGGGEARAANGAARDSASIEVSLSRGAGNVCIGVADHGPGIPAEDRARALKRFVRLEASRSRPGSGLGLSLVAAVARLHKAEVRLDDNQPGLKVTIALPALGPVPG